jgi:hypothetical protein
MSKISYFTACSENHWYIYRVQERDLVNASGSTKGGKFFDQLRDYQHINKNYAP